MFNDLLSCVILIFLLSFFLFQYLNFTVISILFSLQHTIFGHFMSILLFFKYFFIFYIFSSYSFHVHYHISFLFKISVGSNTYIKGDPSSKNVNIEFYTDIQLFVRTFVEHVHFLQFLKRQQTTFINNNKNNKNYNKQMDPWNEQ